MKIYLVRHGEAVSGAEDILRPLSPAGRAEVLRTASSLKNAGAFPDVIWHSPKKRAEETASILGDALKPSGGLVEKEYLHPNGPADDVLLEIEALNKDIMLVSHIPFLPKLASLALIKSGGRGIAVLGTGRALCLERTDEKWRVIELGARKE